jgi:hypothetical protein
MENRLLHTAGVRCWYGTLFWAASLVIVNISLALADQRSRGENPISNIPMRPPAAHRSDSLLPSRSGVLSPDEIASILFKAQAEIAKGYIYFPPGDNATETLERVFPVLPQASSVDLEPILEVRLELYKRAGSDVTAGKLDEADQLLAFADKLPVDQFLKAAAPIPSQSMRTINGPSVPELPSDSDRAEPPPSKASRGGTTPDGAKALPAAAQLSAMSNGPTNAGSPQQKKLRLVIHFFMHSSFARSVARRLSERLKSQFDRVTLQGESHMTSKAIIRLPSGGDRGTAQEAEDLLRDMGYDSHLENASTSSPVSLELWIPRKRVSRR